MHKFDGEWLSRNQWQDVSLSAIPTNIIKRTICLTSKISIRKMTLYTVIGDCLVFNRHWNGQGQALSDIFTGQFNTDFHTRVLHSVIQK